MSKGPHWSPDEIAKLAKIGRRHTIAELAVEMARSDASVRRRLEKLGITPKAAARSDRAANGTDLKSQIERAYDAGLRGMDICRLTGATVFYVSYICNMHRPPDWRPITPEEHRRHLLAVARASHGSGFPYCVARQGAP